MQHSVAPMPAYGGQPGQAGGEEEQGGGFRNGGHFIRIGLESCLVRRICG